MQTNLYQTSGNKKTKSIFHAQISTTNSSIFWQGHTSVEAEFKFVGGWCYWHEEGCKNGNGEMDTCVMPIEMKLARNEQTKRHIN